MEKVPDSMITSKDLNYICDMFNWNLTAYNTLSNFENDCQDEQLSGLISGAKQMHKEACERIVGVINNAG